MTPKQRAQRRWKQANAERVREYQAQYTKRRKLLSPPAFQARDRERNRAFKASRPEIAVANSQLRRARKRCAVPNWFGDFDYFALREAADLSIRREAATGIRWNVDHIVPLTSPRVCGLHVAVNIRVIPATENISKGNRYWPDMP